MFETDINRLQVRVLKRSITYDEAIRTHKQIMDKYYSIFTTLSAWLTVFFAAFMAMNLIYVYDYFTMPFSHWSHLFNYALYSLLSITACDHLGQINVVQEDLKRIVLLAVGDLEEFLQKQDSNPELIISCFGWPLGNKFASELLFLYASAAFLMWQVTQLSKWNGFSFDQKFIEEL